jgi:hypothetical protein
MFILYFTAVYYSPGFYAFVIIMLIFFFLKETAKCRCFLYWLSFYMLILYIHIYIPVYIYTYIYTYMDIYIYIYIYIFISIYLERREIIPYVQACYRLTQLRITSISSFDISLFCILIQPSLSSNKVFFFVVLFSPSTT